LIKTARSIELSVDKNCHLVSLLLLNYSVIPNKLVNLRISVYYYSSDGIMGGRFV